MLAIYADNANRSTNGSVACPAAIEITDGNGETLANLSNFATQCLPNDKNIISFDGEVEVETVNINFFREGQYAVGVCEVEMWVPAITGPFYYAVDALAHTATNVTSDSNVKATSNGAVFAPYTSGSEVDFSGIYSKDGGDVTLGLSYKNNGSSSISIGVDVNQIASGNLTVPVTNGTGYQSATMSNVGLWKGTNFVTLFGGGNGFFLEGLTVQ